MPPDRRTIVPIIIIPRDAAYIGRSPLATTISCKDAAELFIKAGAGLGAGGLGGGGGGGGPFLPGQGDIPPNTPRVVVYPPPPVPPPVAPCCVTSFFFTLGGFTGIFASLNGLKFPVSSLSSSPVCPVPSFFPEVWFGTPFSFPASYLAGESGVIYLDVGACRNEFTLSNSRLTPPIGGFSIYSTYIRATAAPVAAGCLPYGFPMLSTGIQPASFSTPSQT